MKQISKNNQHHNRNRQKSGRRSGSGGGGNNNNNGGNSLNRVYESAGPEGKVRGTAQQIIDKYAALANDAMTAGDRITAEGFHQHAEHYQRIVSTAMAAEAEAREQRAQQQRERDEREQRDRESRQDNREPRGDRDRSNGNESNGDDRDRGDRGRSEGYRNDNARRDAPRSHDDRDRPSRNRDPEPVTAEAAPTDIEATTPSPAATAEDEQRRNPLLGDPRPANDEQPVAEATAPAEEEVKPAPRKRATRARKPAVVAEPAIDGEEPVKPKRGRPRKKVEPEEVSATTGEPDSAG